MGNAAIFAVSFISGVIWIIILKRRFRRRNVNRGASMAAGMGGILALSVLLTFIFSSWTHLLSTETMLVYTTATIAMGIAGLLEDVESMEDASPGNPSGANDGPAPAGGLRKIRMYGFNGLLKGDMPNNIIITMLVFQIAGFVSLILYRDMVSFILDLFILVLCCNLFCALDGTRGRQIKTFFFMQVLTIVVSGFAVSSPAALSVMGGAAACAIPELKQQLRMGATGACILGLWVGVGIIEQLAIPTRFVAFILLVLLNILFETRSADDIMNSNRLLRAVDRWGR